MEHDMSGNFSGQLTEPVPVNEYTYSAQLQTIQCEQEPGTEEIIDGMKYIYRILMDWIMRKTFCFIQKERQFRSFPRNTEAGLDILI